MPDVKFSDVLKPQFDVPSNISFELEGLSISDFINGTVSYEVVSKGQDFIRIKVKNLVIKNKPKRTLNV